MTTGIGLTLPPPLPPTSPTPTVRALPLPRLAQCAVVDCAPRTQRLRACAETMSLVANWSTDDITLERGATALWPCSHRVVGVATHSRADLRDDSMDLEEFYGDAVWSAYEAGQTYPARMVLAKGSVAFRDTRIFHHAVPK